MHKELFYGISQWLILSILTVIFFLSFLLGYWLNKKRKKEREETKDFLSSLSSPLGLLALLLGFTFAMSLDRFESRKKAIVAESNAIAVFAMRLELLPNPTYQETFEILKKYIQLRTTDLSEGYNLDELQANHIKSRELQNKLWQNLVAYNRNLTSERAKAHKDQAVPSSRMVALVLEACNELVTNYNTRQQAMDNHIPEPILILLFVTSIVILFLFGYAHSYTSKYSILHVAVLCILIVLVLMVIIDLDRPRRGLIVQSKELYTVPY